MTVVFSCRSVCWYTICYIFSDNITPPPPLQKKTPPVVILSLPYSSVFSIILILPILWKYERNTPFSNFRFRILKDLTNDVSKTIWRVVFSSVKHKKIRFFFIFNRESDARDGDFEEKENKYEKNEGKSLTFLISWNKFGCVRCLFYSYGFVCTYCSFVPGFLLVTKIKTHSGMVFPSSSALTQDILG